MRLYKFAVLFILMTLANMSFADWLIGDFTADLTWPAVLLSTIEGTFLYAFYTLYQKIKKEQKDD